MDINQISELRLTLLSIMDDIHRVCSENQIQYFVIGGTALGAVRHNGFIPWDTDIDIAMRRKDYERFLEISNNCLSKEFVCCNYKNVKEWYSPHAVVFDTRTMIKWNMDYYVSKRNCPVYVDILPLDYISSDKDDISRQEKIIKRKLYFLSRRECVLYRRNSSIERTIKQVFSRILRFQSNYAFCSQLDSLMQRYNHDNSKMICSMVSHYNYDKLCMEDAIFGTPKLYPFEGRQYMGPEDMIAYLKHMFNDYMQLPPVQQRRENLDYIEKIVFDVPVDRRFKLTV